MESMRNRPCWLIRVPQNKAHSVYQVPALQYADGFATLPLWRRMTQAPTAPHRRQLSLSLSLRHLASSPRLHISGSLFLAIVSAPTPAAARAVICTRSPALFYLYVSPKCAFSDFVTAITARTVAHPSSDPSGQKISDDQGALKLCSERGLESHPIQLPANCSVEARLPWLAFRRRRRKRAKLRANCLMRWRGGICLKNPNSARDSFH